VVAPRELFHGIPVVNHWNSLSLDLKPGSMLPTHWRICQLKVFGAISFTNILRTRFSYVSAFFAKTYLEKSCAKHFRTKTARIKCWWNWHRHNYDQLYQLTQLEVTPNFLYIMLYAGCQWDQCKSTVAKADHRLLMKWTPDESTTMLVL